MIIIFTASCAKHNQSSSNENICVTRVIPKVNDFNVSASSLDSINTLFAANNLSTANLQFQNFEVDSTINVNGGYSAYQIQIMATQFFNGLPVFFTDDFFSFDYHTGIFQPPAFIGYTGTSPNADTTSHQNFANLRNAFLAHLSESYTEGGPVNSKRFTPSVSTYINSCLLVTMGYIDAGMVPGNAANAYNKSLVKVWLVTPSNDPSITYYPLVYVVDSSGNAWGVPFLIP